ncbi:hypothetical protein V8E51_001228 [Hyaloscypha variabilis]
MASTMMPATMANSIDLNHNTARELVEKIARNLGYLSAETLAKMEPQMRLEVMDALRNKDDMIASSVVTLARNLYTSNARFIFELLQNADDNHYTQALAAGDAPYISFRVHHGMLVVECNEDGFTEENIRAICAIGKSSKQGAQGYIGEKGIGFKSTFMAAWKVEIQSGPFSFYFQHRDGDSGMGMIIPIWFEPREELVRRGTRITLHFHDNGQAGDLQRRRDDIIKQLSDLQGTVLLFLKNLRTINITVFDQARKLTWLRKTVREQDALGSSVQLNTIERREGMATKKITHRFHVTRHLGLNLPRNENRTYNAAEEEMKAYSTAEVALAFPLNDNNEPVIEAQELFAFMPVRKIGFNFLIHSDFVTQANRQDIVATSERNIALRKAIGDAFVVGVQQLCTLPNFKYQWMRYLPRNANLPLEPFWKDLVSYLIAVLREKPILYSRSDNPGKLYRITELGRFNKAQLDKDGNPLFPDLFLERYLSNRYEPKDLEILSEYGLQHLQMADIMPRLHALFLQPGWKSKIYQDRDEDWHSRVARLTMQAWGDKGCDWKTKIRRIPLLPLHSATFQLVTSNDPRVFFPDIDSVPIPQDIGLRMIAPAAAANPDCRKLYEALGVTPADPKLVLEKIMHKHIFWKEEKLDVTMSKNHLRYLYQMYPQEEISSRYQDAIVVFDHKERAKHPMKEYVYLPGGGEWSPQNLLQTSQTVDSEALDVSFIHPAYLQDPPLHLDGFEQTWTDWLFSIIYVEDAVQVFTKRDDEPDESKTISKEWLFVVKHWSGKAIARMCKNWQKPDIRKRWEADPYGTNLIRELGYLCVDDARHPLQKTFLPLPCLVTRCQSLLVDVNAIPFLKLDSSLEDSSVHEWASFGKHLDIGLADDLNFSLAVLRAIVSGSSKTKGPLTQTILELYLRIHTQCLASEDRGAAQKRVRKDFAEMCGVLCSPLPLNISDGHNSAGPEWAVPSKCLWDAPARISASVPLKLIWEPVLVTLGSQDRNNLEQFFHHTLLIGDITAGGILKELAYLSKYSEDNPAHSPEIELTYEMYQRLDGLRAGMGESNLKIIKEKFEHQLLIYAPWDPPRRWFKASECLWSGEGVIPGKVYLEPLYPDLTSLFVDYLGVPKLSFALVYRELLNIGSSTPEISYVKNLLWSLKAILPSDTSAIPAFADELASCRIFPVRMSNGSVQPLTANQDFAIIDRQNYADVLKNKIKILDFNLDEVRRLRPLIKWAGLTGRYLSRSVVENTVVDDELCIEDENLTYDLARKAGAFASIAAHFDSPLVLLAPEVMHALPSTKVFIAETITSILIVAQDGEETVTPINNSELHIRTSETGLEIYVPSDEGARDFCIASRLPRQLAAWLLNCNPSKVNSQVVTVVSSIIHAKPTNTGRILEANGIIELNLPPYDKDDDEPISNQRIAARSGSGHPATLAASPNQPGNGRGASFRTAIRIPSSPSPFQIERYRGLLVHVAKIARSIPFPNYTPSFDVSSIPQHLQRSSPGQKLFTFSIGDPAEWRHMVGAAGELFVFELLSALNPRLPSFSYLNWQSTIRHHAKAHPDHSNLDGWNGGETSDIVYSDESGVLTAILMQKRYLDETWRDEKPDYYIEVKATMSNNFETPFHLNKYQYQRMLSCSTGGARLPHQKKKVYVLFRVYGLESGQIGLIIYVDPEVARKGGQLEFEADGWTVKPRARTRI